MRYSIFLALLALPGCDAQQPGGNQLDGQSNDARPDGSAGASARAPSEQPNNPQPIAAPAKAGVAIEPQDETIGWIAADWLGLDLPVRDWARAEVGRQYKVDEFNREEAVAQQLEQTRQARQAGADIGTIRLTVISSLSDYDTEYGEFYVEALAPGSRLTFRPFRGASRNPFPEGVEITFRNSSDASVWSVSADKAQRIAEQLGYGRGIRAEITLHIVKVSTTGRAATILTDVVRYTLYSRKGERLGDVRLDADQPQ